MTTKRPHDPRKNNPKRMKRSNSEDEEEEEEEELSQLDFFHCMSQVPDDSQGIESQMEEEEEEEEIQYSQIPSSQKRQPCTSQLRPPSEPNGGTLHCDVVSDRLHFIEDYYDLKLECSTHELEELLLTYEDFIDDVLSLPRGTLRSSQLANLAVRGAEKRENLKSILRTVNLLCAWEGNDEIVE